MTELFTVYTPPAASERLRSHLTPQIRRERVAVAAALGRVLAETMVAPQDLPEFPRSAMDGYAVVASDTYGATPGLPAFLALVGEVAMGQAATQSLGPGEAILVHTGGMIPPRADAVVMIENTQRVGSAGGGHIEVMAPVAEGQNVLQIGEDIRRGATVLGVGRKLRAQDIGGLLALGITEVTVAARPRVGILSTGDEVVPPDRSPQPGQVRDINSYTLAALAQVVGGEPVRYGIAPDQRTALEQAAARAFAECDLLVFSAGSSVSYRDLTAEVINGLGEPGVLVHGVSIKPGKPTILAVCGGKPVFGLPGNPVSAMVVFEQFVTPTILALLGATAPARQASMQQMQARLARNIASESGREDYIQVRLESRDGEMWAVPVLGKSNLIYTLVNAEGVVKIDLDAGGVKAGEWVSVTLY